MKSSRHSDLAVFYLSAIAFLYALAFGAGGYWWVLTLSVHLTVITVFSAVIHRYYSHKAFEMNDTLAFWLSVLCVGYFYSGGPQWCILHTCHHANYDTKEDSNVKGWQGFFGYGYRQPPAMYFKAGLRLLRERRHSLLHEYAVPVGISFALVFYLLGGFNVFLYGYILPLFTNHLANRIHKQFGHTEHGGANRWWMEYIVPMGGEWIHTRHHIHAREPIFKEKWYQLDLGGTLVKMLSRTA
jgi:fatty-acid desaturase